MKQVEILTLDEALLQKGRGPVEALLEKAEKKHPEKIKGLIKWVGKVGFDACVAKLSTVKGISDPKSVCGAMKRKARERGQLAKKHMGRLEKKRKKSRR